MTFPRKKFKESITYHEEDWDELQDNIGDYYDALIAAIQSDISTILGDYLTSAHRTEDDPHSLIDMDYIKDGTAYKKLTAAQETQLDTIWSAFGGSPSMDNIPQGSGYIKITNTEKGYYDLVYAAFGGSPSMDNIPDGTAYKKLTATQETQLDTIWSAFGGSPSMDNIPQGTAYIKLSAAEYAKFLTGFYDILDQTTTVKFGHGRNITAFYFAKGADADGADIYANNLFSAGNPVNIVVFASPWHLLAGGANTGLIAHGLGYRPAFANLQVCLTDPTGQPEDYIYTEGVGNWVSGHSNHSYAAWNNVNYRIYNFTTTTQYFRVLLFAYLGS